MNAEAARAEALDQARAHCATQAREHARDAWLAALFAPPAARPALHALACFDREIRAAARRAREPRASALRLAWWREVALGERDDEAAGSPVALALVDAIEGFSLPRAWLETMVEARFVAIESEGLTDRRAFEAYAAMSEGARLRLAAHVLGEGRDLDAAAAHISAGSAIAATRALLELPRGSGAALIPADMLARHGASARDLGEGRAGPGMVAALEEMRGLARASLDEAERRLADAPSAILPAFAPLATLRLELRRLERGAARPLEATREVALWRRQWAIWRWMRRR